MWVGKRGLKQTWSGPEEVYYSVIVLGQSQTTATAALNYFHTSSEQDKSQKIAEVGYEKPSTMCGKVFTGTWFLLNHLTHSQYLSHLLQKHSFSSPHLTQFPKQTAHLISISFQRSKPSRTKAGCKQCLLGSSLVLWVWKLNTLNFAVSVMCHFQHLFSKILYFKVFVLFPLTNSKLYCYFCS